MPTSAKSKRVKFVPKRTGGAASPGVEISSEEADRMAVRSRQRLRSSKRLSLVLDLDHTLVECTIGPRAGSNSASSLTKPDGVHEISVQGRLHRIRLRPKIAEFFEGLSPLYESTIYTHGSREYALAVANLIEQTVSTARFGGRIVSRDDCPDLSAKSEKRLDRVFPGNGGTECSFIVDDRHDVWAGDDFDKLVLVEPYKFFDRRQSRQAVGAARDPDAQLVYTRRALVDAHASLFGRKPDQPNSAADALAIIRRAVFAGAIIYFVCPSGDMPTCRKFATAFGANLAVTYRDATHIVVDERRRDRRRSSLAIHRPQIDTNKVDCVHLDWFWFSVWHLAQEDPKRFFVPPHEIILTEDLFDPAPASKRHKSSPFPEDVVDQGGDDEEDEEEGDAWADDFANEIDHQDDIVE